MHSELYMTLNQSAYAPHKYTRRFQWINVLALKIPKVTLYMNRSSRRTTLTRLTHQTPNLAWFFEKRLKNIDFAKRDFLQIKGQRISHIFGRKIIWSISRYVFSQNDISDLYKNSGIDDTPDKTCLFNVQKYTRASTEPLAGQTGRKTFKRTPQKLSLNV